MHDYPHVPQDKPVLLLPNHQNALLDALLIATYSKRAPYFLTRSDVFTNDLLRSFFKLLRMLPVYRIRDGRSFLERNEVIFDICANLLSLNESILIFPEANHNLKRSVRPLSKGFTRILFKAIEKNPDLDIRLVPVGMNYADAAGFPDSVAIYFGMDFKFDEGYSFGERRKASLELREKVAEELKLLTTHIEDGEDYDRIIAQLDKMKVNYLNPMNVNVLVGGLPLGNIKPMEPVVYRWHLRIWDTLFGLLNFPILLIWRTTVKSKVKEQEFLSTYRFLYFLISFPVFYALVFILIAYLYNLPQAGILVLGLFVFNLCYVKFR